MSSESFKRFKEKIQNDQGLEQELRAAGGGAGMPAEAVVAFAARKGYDFRAEDVTAELTDQQLDAVAGGDAKPTPPPPTFTFEHIFDKSSPVISSPVISK